MGESSASSTGQSAAKQHAWVKPDRPTMDKNVELYEIAYDQSKLALEDQSADLNNMRTRSVQYLAFVASATAFLATAVIRSSDRHAAFYTFAWIGTALAVAVLAAEGFLLSPWMTRLKRRADPQLLLKTWIERDVPAPSRAEMLREMALRQEQWERDNDHVISRVRVLYFLLVLLGAGQVAAWATLAWVAA
jgi:hypothetical protein